MLFSVHTDGKLVAPLAIFCPWVRVRYRIRVSQGIWWGLTKTRLHKWHGRSTDREALDGRHVEG